MISRGAGRVRERMDDRTQRRADHLLPEEQAVGSDDAEAQAEAILDDSDAREAYAETAPDLRIDHRKSAADPIPE